MPFFVRGLYFAKAHPRTSFAIAARANSEAPVRDMYISIDQPTRSIRSTPAEDGHRYVIVGGESGRPGDFDTEERYASLASYLEERFGIDSATHRWSTHDFMPVDRLPYIGAIDSYRGIYVATGFAKWGMTKGTLAAMVIRDAVIGRDNHFAALYNARRINARRSLRRFITGNAYVASRFVGDRLRRGKGSDLENLGPGEGRLARVGTRHYALYRDDDGAVHALSARCTHLGCLVGWNSADRTWECPCHGSRFAADGTLIEGPATRDLLRRRLPHGETKETS
jgi:nitrite reductase/ring-hydroxylating ferredoxin subunit